MADSYLAISEIAGNASMIERLNAAVTQQWKLGLINLGRDGVNAFNAITWVDTNRYVWAASPGWGEAWTYARSTHTDVDYDPGRDESVITDNMILATVQALAPANPGSAKSAAAIKSPTVTAK